MCNKEAEFKLSYTVIRQVGIPPADYTDRMKESSNFYFYYSSCSINFSQIKRSSSPEELIEKYFL